MGQCQDCRTDLSPLDLLASFLSGSEHLQCHHCRGKRKRLLRWFQESFHEIAAGGLLIKEWDELIQIARQEGLDIEDTLAETRPGAIMRLEQMVIQAEQQEHIGNGNSVEEIHFLRTIFSFTDQEILWLLARIERLALLSNVQRGLLPSILVQAHLHSDEIPHLEVQAAYHRIHTEDRTAYTQGRFLATSRALYFIAHEGKGSMKIQWKNIMRVKHQQLSISLEVAGGQGGGYYTVGDPLLVKSFLEMLVKTEKRHPLPGSSPTSRQISQEVRNVVWVRDRGRCVQCGVSGPGAYLEFDHIVPHSRGGSNTEANVQLLCRRCNLKKGNRI